MKKSVSALILCCALSNPAQALQFNQISQVYFFGDSLSDGGFNDVWANPMRPPLGKAPTFVSFGGYTWAQYVARDIKGFILPVYPGPFPEDTLTNNSFYSSRPIPKLVSGKLTGVNYAASGSTTSSTGFRENWAPSLQQQITKYLATSGGTADPNAVYFIWAGANDILILVNPPTMPTDVELLTAAQKAATNIGNVAALLSASGAKRIVVLSLPNVGMAPLIARYAAVYNMPALPGYMKNVSFFFNSMLNTQLGKVIAKYGTHILLVNVYGLFDNVVLATQKGQPYTVAGQSFQFVNYKDPACETAPSAMYCPSSAPNNYIFADMFHLSDMSHRLLSLEVEKEIQRW
jgi:outer membrane lipase/esterase